MAVPTFSAPVITQDGVTGLYHASFTVSDTDVKAEGVGDTPYQAKRHAVVTYRKANPLAFLDIPA
ncbi:hypothetical protein [Psychrobacter sp. UBA2514]|jgi:hypothetical protein|uniref:hypothetical protein n=1 Tax=Psychrobacter sp. UBA2514 TaxID=1947346 RepID=UPI0025811701|nr:hypothetical protein [Psychrobacter sp. UBA2514]|tara:strand:+ start:3855 stop:4049 length:195 start_codon:yes stop_codon:yes gene_type:complete